MRGLSVALIEAEDFGSGTSSRSSKMIHGGLRYLPMGDIALVREAASERKAVQAIRQGREPDGIDPATHAVRSASIVLPESVSFHEGAADALKVREGAAPISV